MVDKVLEHLGEHRLELGPAAEAVGQGHWRYTVDSAGIGWLVLDKTDSSVNTISGAVLRDLEGHVEQIEANPPEALVIRSAKSAAFAAGADIEGFAELADRDAEGELRAAHAVLDRLEGLSSRTIAVVHGATLGAGFELTLACDYRIAVEGASFAFPEVHLGLHPGLGGTFRLTGLIDPTEAMTLILTGKPADAGKAKDLGIVDMVTQERHVAAAVRAIVAGEVDHNSRGLAAKAYKLAPARRVAARRMRAKTEEKAPREHYPAPWALIDLWEQHGGSESEMQTAEIESFAELLRSNTCRNLVRAFFLRQALKGKARGEDEIGHVHVVGAGEMGAQIAPWAALNGKLVTLGDMELAPLGAAMKSAAGICKDKHLSSIETREVLDRLIPDPRGYGLAHADLVIEAGPEDAETKAKIYAELGPGMKSGAILATNTSSLPMTELATRVRAPSRFAGLHFFNPVSKMHLVEVVTHERTSNRTRERLTAFCGAIDRLPVRVGDYPGFLVNRALTPYLLEAMVLLDEGVDKESVDRAALSFGMPMGPVTLADQVGLDICLSVAKSLRDNLPVPMAHIPDWVHTMVEDGKTGKKAGQGFYDWSSGPPKPGMEAPESDDMTDRLILPMINACAECLRMGVVESEDTVDGAMIFGTGFAPFRGGPMHYARSRGFANIQTGLHGLTEAHGARFAPDAYWTAHG
ncbi:3-hydroxyacyl-CoA dehydrogenase NAD-binding domain-containing protein [Aquisalimonas sp.]|uniref:3-hydroxyacyl-CoA dehydrogenase NAD-binding domain-containing protein n=1 Tax=Aquisalimonas sp. TaxID=1872621 RepID=UPI0025B8990D|nr:3-hydroxyacyl-CoA dehydrogenase NAD-binding domain-containing protein [Aquisalimonas sp.]